MSCSRFCKKFHINVRLTLHFHVSYSKDPEASDNLKIPTKVLKIAEFKKSI